MTYCIPADLIEKLKPRMKQVGGAKLVAMTPHELDTFFSETVGEVLGKEVSKSFRKASLSHEKNAMKQWAKKTLTPDEAKAVGKIADSRTEEDTVYETIDGDVIERALGADITPEEVDTINTLMSNMLVAESLPPDNPFSGYHTDYFKAQKELNDYLDTVNPMSNMSVLSRVVFRGNLLFAPKSIITNIVGNLTGGVSETIVRMMEQRKLTGANSELIRPYIKYAYGVYAQTGQDVVRAMEAVGHQSVLGEHFQGVGDKKGIIRGYGRFVEQYVLRMGQGAPDIAFASAHFADSINMQSTKMADAKGLKGDARKQEAKRLFLMATSLNLDPNEKDHAEALLIKHVAVQYALTATYQNNTAWTKTTLGIRNAVDDYTGDLNLGTNLAPFVKTLVNIAKLSIDMTGVTLSVEIPRLISAYRNGDAETVRKVINVITRAGMGMVLVTLLASIMDDDDYIPDYTIATAYQKEVAKLANAPHNSIRIGDKWVSLSYFGTFGYAIAGVMGAKQKKTAGEALIAYHKNILFQLRQTPVIQQVLDIYDYAVDIQKYNKTGEEVGDEAIASIADFFASRLIPSVTGDIAKSMDNKERFAQYGFDGIVDQLQQKIPMWREGLPPKYNNLGEEIATESWYWTLLTGARVKTAPKDTQLYSELVRLSSSGEDVTLKLNTFNDVKIAKEMLTGQEYNELTGQLQKELSNAYANIMATERYQNEEDQERQKKLLMDVRDNVVKRVLRQQGYYSEIREIKRNNK